MFCPKCGMDNPDRAVYCGTCGMPLPQGPPVRSGVVGYCPSCGVAIAPGLQFCPTCGAPLGDGNEGNGSFNTDDGLPASDLRDQSDAHPHNRRNQVAWFIVFAVIIATAGMLWSSSSGQKGKITAADVGSAADGFEKVKQNEISNEGYDTAEEAVQTIEMPLNAIYSNLKGAYENGVDDESIRDFAQTVYNGMPSAFTKAVTSSENMTEQEAIDEMAQGFYSSLGIEESDLEYIDKLSFNAAVKLADKLDSDELDAVNEWLDKAGMVNEATAGYKIGETLTAEAVDGSVDLGDSSSQDISDIRLEVIEVGGKWFIWSSTFS